MMDNVTSPGDVITPIQTIDVVLTISVSSLSIAGGFVIFFAHHLRHKYGKPVDEPRQLLIYLTIADMFNAFGQLLGAMRFLTSEDNTAERVLACHQWEELGCIAQSFITTLSSMSSFFWTTIIAFHLYWTYDGSHQSNTKNYIRTVFYHFLSWGIPSKYFDINKYTVQK